MNIGINPKSGIILVALITLLIGGLAYALSTQRTISGSAVVGQVQTGEDTILLWESLDPKVPLEEVPFGSLDIDAFGNLQTPARFPVWVENGGGTPFTLTVEATNIMVTMPATGAAPMDGALRMLFGPAGGNLRPAPDHDVMIEPGAENIFAGELSLEFLKTPEELGGTDTQISFDVVFKAEGQSVPQSNGGTPDVVIDLTAEVVQWEVLDGVFIEVWGYNGQYPGPEIRVREGQRLRVNFTNNLPEPTTIHWHGQDVPNDQDGVPGITQPDIPPGGTWTYEFVLPRPSTGMYHTHSNVASQLAKGLFGAFIVEPAEGLAQYDREYTMLMHEIQGYYTINGHSFPKTLEDSLMKIRTGERILIRLANPGRQHHPMHLHGQQFKVVGVDGSPLPFPLLQNTFDLAPGQTAYIEVEGANPGTWGFHCHVPTHVTNFGSYPGGMITMLDYEDHTSYFDEQAAQGLGHIHSE